MAVEPLSVQIRSYQVGFGDCFLLSFVYSESDSRHVLIDFGTTGLPRRGSPRRPTSPKQYMPIVARDIARVCGAPKGRLTAVVATHRHADHISGFATDSRTGNSGSIIRALRPRRVLQPWTEDPDARRDATAATRESNRSRRSFVAGLASMHIVAQQIAELAESGSAWMGTRLRNELMFLGSDNIHNKSAVENLIAMGKAPGATARYLHYGSSAGLQRLLPGVKVRVLGPPDLRQSEKIRRQRSRDPDQFWHLLAGIPGSRLGPAGANRARRRKAVPVEARWFRDRLNSMHGQQLLEIVRALDDQMNNTSLILLFEVFGKKLLFPGDAQLENWSYALEDAPDSREIRRLLADVDVYKVGHHGSLNATPRQLLWEGFRKRKGRELRTLLSTLPGKHGSAAKGTEVPRRSLLRALKSESKLKNTDDLHFGANPELCHVVELEP